MDARAEELIKQGDQLFDRGNLLNLWQTLAENFHPVRADFTNNLLDGDDITEHLSTSFPVMVHRDMTNAFSAMLRQRGTRWFKMTTGNIDVAKGPGRKWLERASEIMFRAMYDRKAQFVRATKQGDADFALIGQTVLYVDTINGNTLHFRNYHVRDCAWAENALGEIDTLHRRWKPTIKDLHELKNFDLHKDVKDKRLTDPFKRIECRHIMVPTDKIEVDGTDPERRFAFRSFFIDVENKHIMEDVPSRLFKYVIPRWQTVSGSVYAYSPAAITALPDARMIQAMTYTLLDAGEKATAPPMIGQADIIKSDVDLRSRGITWVDPEYDERNGDALRPIPLDLRGVPIGTDQMIRAQQMIAEAFYLNKIALPQPVGERTAFETAQLVKEYIRQALPLFEPVEAEYNGALCEMVFDTLQEGFAFGGPQDMPEELSGAEVDFLFESPLQENEERQKPQVYLETKTLLDQAASVDPSLMKMVDGRTALRDALQGAGTPAKWMLEDSEMDEIAQRDAEQSQQAELLNQIERSGQVAEQAGKGAQAISDVIGNG